MEESALWKRVPCGRECLVEESAIPGDSGHYQSDGKKSGSDGGHHIPHEARGPGGKPGWPAPHEKEEEPFLETVAITSQMKKKEWQ